MDGGRFDGLARALAAPQTRRNYLVAAFGILGAAVAVRGTTGASQTCRGEGEPCALNSACCSGHFCESTSLFNPNVGVCRPGADPTSSSVQSRTPTAQPTRTPKPTRTPRPTRTPEPTLEPGRGIDVPITITLNCAPGTAEQSITFRNHRRLTIDVLSFRTLNGFEAGANRVAGPVVRRNRTIAWQWRCDPSARLSCKSSSALFGPSGSESTDGIDLRIQYEGVQCHAQITCVPGQNTGNMLRCRVPRS